MYAKIRQLLTQDQRKGANVLVALMFVGMIFETLSVGLIVPVVAVLMQDNLAARYPAFASILDQFGNTSHEAIVVGVVLGLVGLYVFKTLFLAFLAWRQTWFAFGIQAELSRRLFALYLRQPYTFHLQRNSAQLIRNVVHEVSVFTSNVLAGMTLFAETLVMIGLCGLLLVIEPLGTVTVGCVLGVAALGFHYFTRGRVARWGEARQYHEGLRLQHLQQGLGGAKEVKLLGREGEFLEQYDAHNVRTAHALRLQVVLQQLPRLWLELLAAVGLAALVLAMLLQQRALVHVLPTLGLFAAAAFRLMPSVNRILGSVQTLRYGLAVINTLETELRLSMPSVSDRSIPIARLERMLELHQVTYTYPGATEPALHDVSLRIRRGESVGIVGASGSGKSTLVDVILGLLVPDSGEVRVDGMNIQKHLRGWQDQIGYVPQSIFLSDDTLRRNVAFGVAEQHIDDLAVQRAIRAAQLEEFLSGLPYGVETMVGERGVRLSGGQRQRIGIARALYHDPAILVLDEATSALDTLTEHGVIEAVAALQGSKTILIVAHRLSTVERCSRLYRMHEGRGVEQGAPAKDGTRATKT